MSSKKKKYRFLNLSNAAKELEVDTSIISRGVEAGKLPGGEMQVYVKVEEDGKEEYFEVGKSTIKVVDMDKIKTEKVQVVKFKWNKDKE